MVFLPGKVEDIPVNGVYQYRKDLDRVLMNDGETAIFEQLNCLLNEFVLDYRLVELDVSARVYGSVVAQDSHGFYEVGKHH